MRALILALGLVPLVAFADIPQEAEQIRLQYVGSEFALKLGSDPKAIAAALSEQYQLGINADQLELQEVQESLLGTHYRFAQKVNGLPVSSSEFIFTADESGTITKFYNTTAKVGAAASKSAKIPLIAQDKALELAWQKLAADGELLAAPKVSLELKKNLTMVYAIDMSVTSPYGYWKVEINAATGDVVSISDNAMTRKAIASISERLAGHRVAGDFKAANAKAHSKLAREKSKVKMFEVTADGTGTSFDPNPVISLRRDDLQDDTDDAEFLPAYRQVTLKDLTVVNGVFNLAGPNVKLIDFESPVVAPSTSTNGVWDYKRKDVRFNDAMTYYQLDQSVRYLESLGYVGAKKIFKAPLEVDANGMFGQDNSHYVLGTKRLAYGHGCVDDNEDSDVILHELGHAIHMHINPNFMGGDTGAMGEGFGDYWAAAYSATKENGLDFHPEWIFKWDGTQRLLGWPQS